MIIASTSTVHGSSYLAYLTPILKDHFKGVKELLFIPYARPGGISYDEYTAIANSAFSKLNIHVKGIHEFEDPKEAYKGFGSSGMVKTNEKGTVTFTILCPASYKVKGKVPFMAKTLESHVHYRYEDPSYPGMFSSVKNKFVTC